ncbi:AbrB/MazE/SpoVT family DNA-binding domain-containing protein [Niveispirillum sp. BGYR6]|uniref:AbrB/MazE/SpoVT family DNA-binding domain-containing protein n=1 Tax=Niveispirillum sp. BGYR6 TaxID=2971249 RepID=UPI0022B9D0D1|nr:AbrB/MazE/SpoVT family DNA-binding domain-containing protein [Niveispirillum sp. BGYR6]MDG5496648.1 AbrB/MazE/SpoVT family DNA-binding domain-containing protein [Niveispirillum sp. BGYR6]
MGYHLTLNDECQITLPAELLAHLGLEDGGILWIEKRPNGILHFSATPPDATPEQNPP